MTLEQFFQLHNRVAIAFSGGVDSAYLLYSAIQNGAQAKAYYIKSAFQPKFELEDARKLAAALGAQMEILDVDILCHGQIVQNPSNRCYHCKKVIFQTILQAAARDGYTAVLDGTNASDEAADRPGMQALQELCVLSPLRLCGLTKENIRHLSKEAGLFTWDKPAYACLATRIPTGEEITQRKLERTEQAERFLDGLGFRDFRVRSSAETAKIQLTAADFSRMADCREAVFQELKRYYQEVTLDLEVRK